MNKIKKIFDEIQKSKSMDVFKTIENWPNLAKSYLFQVEFKDVDYNSGKIYNDLMLKVRKVDFHENDDGFDITFDEFEDFKVIRQLLVFIKAKVKLDITIKFYDSELKKVLYTYTMNNRICKRVFPVNLDVSSGKELTIKAQF